MSPVRQNDVFGQLGRMNTEPTNVSVFIATFIASSVLTNFFRDQAHLHTSESQTKQCFLHLSSLYSEACSQVRLLYIKWKPLSTVDYCSIVIVLMLSITFLIFITFMQIIPHSQSCKNGIQFGVHHIPFNLEVFAVIRNRLTTFAIAVKCADYNLFSAGRYKHLRVPRGDRRPFFAVLFH